MSEATIDRDPLEQLADEFAARCRRGESPSVAEYAARHPGLAGQIAGLFPAVVMLEQLRDDERARRKSAALRNGSGRPPEQLGDFVILRELGRGGMGIVYEAEQRSLGRRVAVKVLPKHMLLLDKQLLRFQREAQTAARLQHTHIVPVFGAGEQEGLHYYVMPLVRGVGLDEVLCALQTENGSHRPGSSACRTAAGAKPADIVRELIANKFPELSATAGGHGPGSRSPVALGDPAPAVRDDAAHGWRWVASIGVQAAEALQHAHEHRILHRDIKPSNLLIDEDGVVCVADFGLARAIDPGGASQTSGVAGTLRYMAPEQWEGAADARSDLYSLGLTLYELLTRRPVFPGGERGPRSAGRLFRPGPWPPRRVDAAVPRDLETILLKCLAAEPGQRYQTARELAADLRCCLQDRPILARRATARERVQRWCRRNPALAAMSALAGLLLVAIVATAVASGIRTQTAYAEATRSLARAESTSRLAREALDGIYRQLSPDRLRIAASSDREPEGIVPPKGREVQVPASREVASVLENLLVYYDRLAQQDPSDQRLVLQSAMASRRVGDIRQRLGQLTQAEQEYRSAAAKLAGGQPSADMALAVQTELARIHNELGNVHSARFELGRAHQAHQQALRILDLAGANAVPTGDYRYELARTLYFLASKRLAAMDRRRDGDGSEPTGSLGPHYYKSDEYRRTAIAMLEALAREHPAAPDYRFLLALCYRLSAVGPPPARSAARTSGRARALQILEQLRAQYPDVADYRYELAVTCAAVPVGLFPCERPSDRSPAVESQLRRALDELEWLVAQHANIPEYARCRSVTLASLGMWHRQTGRLEQAVESLEQACQAQSRMLAGFPELPAQDRALLELLRLRSAQVCWERRGAAADQTPLRLSRESLEACVRRLTELTASAELARDGLVWKTLPEAQDTLSLVLSALGEAELAARAARDAETVRNQGRSGRGA